MKEFQLVPKILEFDTFRQFASALSLGAEDLILTNAYIYQPYMQALQLSCQVIFQEKYGAGEPTDTMTDAILSDIRKTGCKRIIAVGGGTIIDIAKTAAVSGNVESVDALYEAMSSLQKSCELIIVPTTCGTGSEVTNISIINRTRLGTKQGLVSPAMYADRAVLIPQLLGTLPYQVFATSSIDALIHAVESFLSPNATPFSMLFSKQALILIVKNFMAVAANGADSWKYHAAEFLRASTLAGIAFGNAGCAAVHAMSYPLGGTYHIPHGEANQLMFAAVMRKYQEKKPIGRLGELETLLAELMGCEDVFAMESLYQLMDKILTRRLLRTYGIQTEDFAVFVSNVLETQQRLLKNSYTPLTAEDMMDIYQKSY